MPMAPVKGNRKSSIVVRLAQFATLKNYFLVLIFVCSTLAWFVSTVTANDLNANWQGAYEYDYNGGKTFGGSPVTEHYTLRISSNIVVDAATLTINGFQKDEVIYGDISGNSNEFSVLFHSYANGQILNEYGVAQFRVGDVLMTLRKAWTQNGVRLETTWGAIVPGDKLSKTGLYFKKK
jgi:hypothetical protein